MLDEPMIRILPSQEAKIEHLIAKVPALEVKHEVPSVEQIHVNDEMFQHTPSDADNVAGVLGLVSGMMLLHDVAVDTMRDVDDLEGHLLREQRKDNEEDEE
jgi:hypothetical protein